MRTKFKIELPIDVLQMNKVFKSKGFELFVVGGAVRDALLGIKPKDFDLATNAEPDIVEEIMRMGGFKTLATGKAFGVINVFAGANEFEVATFRKDIGIGRRPDSVEFTTIEGDVQRRDLTCNALFYDIETEEIVDLVGGIEDIKNGVVKTVGSAKDRFNEDRLRILRAIRFAGRFNCDLDKDIIDVLKNDNSLEGISGERIHDEFIKGVKTAESIKHFLEMIEDFKLFDWIFPDLKIENWVPNTNDPILIVSMLLHKNDTSTLGKKLNELKFSSNDVKDIVFLISLQKINVDSITEFKKNQKRTNLTDGQIIFFATMFGISFDFMLKFINFELSVDGEFVMEKFGIKAGRELGEKIKMLEIENFLKL